MLTFDIATRPTSIGDEMLMVRYQRDANIAAEVFMLDHCSALRYNDLMSKVGSDQISSTSLLAYLDTRSKREGIIDQYKQEYKTHFDYFGKWQARYVFDFWKFVCERLTSTRIGGMLRTKQTRLYGQNSLNDPHWMEQMMAASSLRLLEDLKDSNALASNSARNAIRTIRLTRDAIDGLAASNNRTAKRNGVLTKFDADRHHQETVRQLQMAVTQSLHDIDSKERAILDEHQTFFADKKKELLLLEGGEHLAIR